MLKTLGSSLFVGVAVALLAGCASDEAIVPKIPTSAKAKMLDYNALPENKVFVLAVDPSGDYAFGYAAEKATIKEAAREATIKCDRNRRDHMIHAKPFVYAINDKVVWEEMVRKGHLAK